MSILRITRNIGRLCSIQRPVIKYTQNKPLATTLTYYQPWRFYSCQTIPETKDAESILSVLDTLKDKKTAADYNELLKQLASEGRSDQSQKVYDEIFRNHEVKADATTYSQLMLSYINDGKYEDAMEIYYELRDHEDSANVSVKNLRLDAETYGDMIRSLTDEKNMTLNKTRFDSDQEPLYEYSVEDVNTFVYHDVDGDSQPALLTALALFNDMRHLEIRPTSSMYIDMLKCCERQRDGYVLEKLHKLIRMDLYLDPDLQVFNHLMKAYKIVGDGSSVLEIWDMAETSNNFDNESVSIVIETCLENGFISRLRSIWQVLENKNQLNSEKTLEQLLQERGYI